MNLSLIKLSDVELLAKIPDYGKLLRIACWVQFKAANGWYAPQYAIIDTGAHTSLLPLSLWQELEVRMVTNHYVRGLVPKKECTIDVKVGWVVGKLVDMQGNTTPEMKVRAFLSLTDNIPLIVGFKDLMDKCELYFNSKSLTGYIEIS
ncbi:MAG: hypothetical protein ACFFCD_14560 [Promethearchaeota archaeon]